MCLTKQLKHLRCEASIVFSARLLDIFAASESWLTAPQTLRFDVQADDVGKPVAVAVKPVLGRK